MSWSNKWALSITAGILLGLSFPPFPFPFLLFPAWVLLFRLAELAETKRKAIFQGYIVFVIWNLITTYWLMMATLSGGIAAILANSAVMTVPFVVQRQFQKKLYSPWFIAVSQAAVWISYEYLHHQWDLAWPWLVLGNAWSNVPLLVQYISSTSHLGISFWVLITSGFAYQAIRSSNKIMAWSAIGIGLLFPVISLVQYQVAEFTSEESIKTVVIQPNFDTYREYGGYDNAYEALDLLLNLSDSLRTDSTDLVVWPESAIRSNIYSGLYPDLTSNHIKKQLLETADAWNTTLISGAVYFEFFEDNAPDLYRWSGTRPYLYYNAALGFLPDSSLQVYRKHNLVPLVERIPFIHFLNAIDVFELINWAKIQKFGKGRNPDQFNVNGAVTPALVCYDSVFPDWVRQYIKLGAGFITIITNDGWWGDTSGHIQHFAYARLRAIEFRRWIVRSANNGISGIIDPYGHIKVETDYRTKMAFRYDVPVLTEQTLYARWGDWFPWLMMILTVSGILMLIHHKFSQE